MNCPYCNSLLETICNKNNDHLYVYTGMINILSFSIDNVVIQVAESLNRYGLSVINRMENEDIDSVIERTKSNINNITTIDQDSYNQIILFLKDKNKLQNFISKIVVFQ